MRSGWYAAALALSAAVAAPSMASDLREAVLQLVSISSALRDEARAGHDKGMLGMDLQSRMSAPECAELLQDVASMRNLQAVSARGGELAVKWHGKRDLVLDLSRDPAFSLLVRDAAGPACAVKRGPGKLTPVLLDLPGMKKGPAQVFVVDPVRSPSHEPLK